MSRRRPPSSRHQAAVLFVGGDAALAREVNRASRRLRVRLHPPVVSSLWKTVGRARLDLLALDLDVLSEPLRLLSRLRSNPATTALPRFVMGSSRESRDIITALRAGAVEYAAKPVAADVLAARIRALLDAIESARRSPAPGAARALDGRLRMDRGAARCVLDGKDIALSLKEFEILDFVVSRGRRPIYKEELLASVWPAAPDPKSSSLELDQYVARLRRKVRPLRRRLKTLRGVGYRLE